MRHWKSERHSSRDVDVRGKFGERGLVELIGIEPTTS